MVRKRKKLIIVSIVLSVPIIFFVSLYVKSQSLEGMYRSKKVEILMDDYKGYEYYKDGKFYSVNLSKLNGDKVHFSGTYKKIDQYKYLVSATWDLQFEVEVDLFGLTWSPEYMKKLHLPNDHGTIVFSPLTRTKIQKLVEEYEKKKLAECM